MFKIGHTADTHLRARQYARSSRSMDFHRAFQFVLTDSAEQGVDALVVVGDILDSSRPNAHTVGLLKHLHEVAISRKLLVLCTSGNHDKSKPSWIDIISSGNSPYGLRVLDNKTHVIEKGDHKLLVTGLPYYQPEELRAILPTLEDTDILLWHGDVKEFGNFNEDAITCEELSRAPAKMVLLGDIHKRDYLEVNGKIIGYPGATELCKSNEPDEHSYEIFDIDKDAPTRPVIREKHIQSQEDADALVARVRREAHTAPMVFVEHTEAVKGLRERILSIVPEDSIVSVRKIPKFINMMAAMEVDDRGLEPKDFVKHFFDPGTLSYEIAVELTKHDVHVPDILEQFIERRLNEITEAKAN